jgi:hypothetical protein
MEAPPALRRRRHYKRSLNKVPIKGRERVMTDSTEPSAGVDLQALLAVVRNSPIILCPIVPSTAAPFVDWTTVRKSGNADAFILAWIASHVRGAKRVSRVFM